jgi:hypothetical protein
MRLLSVECNLWEAKEATQWLDREGITIFKTVDTNNILSGLGLQITHVKIIVCVMTGEEELMLKLKYPFGSFENHT